MPVVTTYAEVGIKEDISDLISNIAPTFTPFQTMIGSENIHNILHQWQEDTLDAASTSNAAIQGADAPSSTYTPTVLRNNITQIFTKTAMTAGTADAVTAYGRDKEISYQLVKKSKEIKRDFEATLLSGQTRVVGNGSTVAGVFDAAQVMIDSTHKWGADTLTNTIGGGSAAFSEQLLLNANQSLYADGGEATILMIKPSDSLKVAAFQAASGRTRFTDNSTAKKVVNVVDIYVSPFGEQKVILNRFIKSSDALLFDPSNWKKLVLRNWFRKTLAITGDSLKIQMLGEFSLKHMNFKASALLTDLT